MQVPKKQHRRRRLPKLIFYSDDTSRTSEVRHALEPWASSKGIVAAVENDCLALGLDVLPGSGCTFDRRKYQEGVCSPERHSLTTPGCQDN